MLLNPFARFENLLQEARLEPSQALGPHARFQAMAEERADSERSCYLS